jgi:hypothetical protein
VRTAEEAMERARQRGHPADISCAERFAGIVQGIRGDIETRAAMSDELERLAREHGLSFYVDVLVPTRPAWPLCSRAERRMRRLDCVGP